MQLLGGGSSQIRVRCCVTLCSVSCGLCLACSGLCWAVFSNPQPPPMPRAVQNSTTLYPSTSAWSCSESKLNSTGLHFYICRDPCTPLNLHHCSSLTVGNIHVGIFIIEAKFIIEKLMWHRALHLFYHVCRKFLVEMFYFFLFLFSYWVCW